MTTQGPISPDNLGIVLPHEHLILQGWDHTERNYFNSAYMELVHFTGNAGKTIVDLSSIGMKRDIAFVHRLANHASIQLIIGTGFYKQAWVPQEMCKLGEEELANLMVQEIIEGVDDSGIHAGVIGELGISRPITTFEEKVLRAAAMAQKETGAAMFLHFDIGNEVSEYLHVLNILKKAKANLLKVAVCHLISSPRYLELILELSRWGCMLEFDLFGQYVRHYMKEMMRTHEDVQLSSIRGFLGKGLIGQMLVSQNVNHIDLMTVNGGEGYGYLLKKGKQRFIDYGIKEEDIHTMMVENPKILLRLEC